MYTELHDFWSNVKQRKTPDPKMMSTELGYIRFNMWRIIGSRRLIKELEYVFDLSVAKQLSHRTGITRALGVILSSIDVPQAEQPAIINEILQVFQVAVPMLPIDVNIMEQTYTYYVGPFVRGDQRVSSARVDFKPATKSSIESLENVRLDSLEEPESLCAICSDGLAEGGVHQLIARMPCSHLYHGHCIVRWLEINHLCPLCRYPMPISREG